MPLTSPSSYVSTTSEFIAHWESADAALGAAGPIVVGGGVTLPDFKALRESLIAERDQVIADLNAVEFASGSIKQAKQSLIARFQQFAARVRALYENEPWAEALPYQPEDSFAESKFLAPLVEVQALWEALNAAGEPVLLIGDYTVADFAAELDALRAVYTAWTRAGAVLRLTRARRNALQKRIYSVLKQYRQLVPGMFPEGSPYVTSLPALTPKPGHTPKPVAAAASWDAASARAKITWEASDEATLKEYQVRGCPGDKYDTGDEHVVAHAAPSTPRECLTTFGLAQTGSTASFRVYVILDTGNEKGSDTVSVERPP